MSSITYTAQRPDIAPPTGSDVKVIEMVESIHTTVLRLASRSGGEVDRRPEWRKPQGDEPGAHAVPTEVDDNGERYWPIFLRDGVPVHPVLAAHDLSSGAELLTPEDEALAILEETRRDAGGIGYEGEVPYEDYVRVVIAAARGQRANGARRLEALLAQQPSLDADAELPEGAVRREPSDGFLVSLSDVAEVFGRDKQWVRRAVDRGELPAPAKKIGRTLYFRSTAIARALAA